MSNEQPKQNVLAVDTKSWTYAVVEAAVEAIATIDESGLLQYVNPASQRLFGYSSEELIGRNVSMLMPSPYREAHDEYLNRYLKTESPRIIGIGREVVGLRKDGTTFPMHLAVSEVRMDGQRIFTGIIHDISEQVRSQEEKDRLLEMLDQRNREIECLYRIGQILQERSIDNESLLETANILRSTVGASKEADIFVEFDDRWFPEPTQFETTVAVPIKVAGRERGHVGIAVLSRTPADAGAALPEVHNLLEVVARLIGESCERSEAEARVIHASKLASIGELAAGVGHEINNPVNGILNCADLILKDADSGSTAHTFADLIRSEANRIATIVQNLLTFSRQDSSRFRETDLAEMVDSVLSLSHKMLERSQVHLDLNLPEDLSRPWCREGQLQQVVMNLVINAVHALDEKYPQPSKEKRLMLHGRAESHEGKPHVALVVEDSGAGISPESRDRIFDPFFTTKGRNKGTGLGLSISDAIIREHGGRIEVESEPGKFARFTVLLPVHPPGVAPERTSASESDDAEL